MAIHFSWIGCKGRRQLKPLMPCHLAWLHEPMRKARMGWRPTAHVGNRAEQLP